MREPRNPFRMRTSEQIESNETFVRLFSSEVFDALPVRDDWHKVHIIRSAPGAGKTTLLRALTPPTLSVVHRLRRAEEFRELNRRMCELNVITEKEGPVLCAIMLSCKGYATLENSRLDPAQKERLFFALLNARVVLSGLRNIIALSGLKYPDDLSMIAMPEGEEFFDRLKSQRPRTGMELHQWASAIELSVFEAIDSYSRQSDPAPIEGHSDLSVMLAFRRVTVQGTLRPYELLVLLDDVHQLTRNQRRSLHSELLKHRYPVGVWLAERLEALEPVEVLEPGSIEDRDHRIIDLENFWRSSPKRFQRVVRSISDRRTATTRDVQIPSFEATLQDSLSSIEYQKAFKGVADQTRERVQKLAGTSTRYGALIEHTNADAGTSEEEAQAWKKLEIFVEREKRRNQFAFDLEVDPEVIDRVSDGKLQAAAEFLVKAEGALPLYYGFDSVASASSANIEQFIGIGADLFEEVLGLDIVRRGRGELILPARRQHAILKAFAKQRWDEIPRRIAFGRDIHRLLSAVRTLCRNETFKPNAPYAPGVTGFAISMRDRDELVKAMTTNGSPAYQRLARVLAACIAHNLLEAELDKPQGQPGQKWMVLWLNRWLCIHFDLPMNYGGWRPRSLRELTDWTAIGAEAVKQPSLV